jgi:hypothetical protein
LYLFSTHYNTLHLHEIQAGLDEVIKLWDLRNTASPIASYHGHVPASGRKLKSIHRPAFLTTAASSSAPSLESFILSGGETSHAISMFQLTPRGDCHEESSPQSVFSRGRLPMDVGDIGSLAVHGRNVAVAAGGEVLLLSLS